MKFELQLSGVKELEKVFMRKEKNLTKGLDREMTATTLMINAKQKRYTPVDTGRLRQGNVADVSKFLDKRLDNIVRYAPYIEFGTGGLVEVPTGLEDIAIQFKGKGIRKVNIAPQPFFYRAYFEERAKFIERVKKLLKE